MRDEQINIYCNYTLYTSASTEKLSASGDPGAMRTSSPIVTTAHARASTSLAARGVSSGSALKFLRALTSCWQATDIVCAPVKDQHHRLVQIRPPLSQFNEHAV
jgi:hypothetical protein